MFRILLLASLLLIFIGNLRAQKIVIHAHDCSFTDTDYVRMVKAAEFQTKFYAEVFGPRDTMTIHMNFYSDTSQLRRAERHSMGFVASNAGVFNPISEHIFLIKPGRYGNGAYHEISHALYHHHSRLHPIWMNEGLAEYFQQVIFDSINNVEIGTSISKNMRMKNYIADSTFTIKRVLHLGPWRFYNDGHQTFNYTVSWSIVYYLRTFHDDIFRKILIRSTSAKKCCKAIEQEYPGGISKLEKDIIAHFKSTPEYK